jgi:hypothetical protein
MWTPRSKPLGVDQSWNSIDFGLLGFPFALTAVGVAGLQGRLQRKNQGRRREIEVQARWQSFLPTVRAGFPSFPPVTPLPLAVAAA